jgi:hypothetical protein
VNIVIGAPIFVHGPAEAGEVHESGEPRKDREPREPREPAETGRRVRVGRAAITEQSARVRAAIQQAFDSAEASLQR